MVTTVPPRRAGGEEEPAQFSFAANFEVEVQAEGGDEPVDKKEEDGDEDVGGGFSGHVHALEEGSAEVEAFAGFPGVVGVGGGFVILGDVLRVVPGEDAIPDMRQPWRR